MLFRSILGIVSLVTDVFMASNFARNATTALIIFSMIVISGIIRLIQELRAKSTAAQLDRLIHEKVTVRRNGELREIPGEELVVGDLVLFSAGDRVPADIRLTKVTDLFISQAAITGESAILEKSCRTLCYKEQEPITQLENLAFMQTKDPLSCFLYIHIIDGSLYMLNKEFPYFFVSA